jgi:hypothetical protein
MCTPLGQASAFFRASALSPGRSSCADIQPTPQSSTDVDIADGQSGDHKSPTHHLRMHIELEHPSISLTKSDHNTLFPHRFPPTDKHVSSQWCDHQCRTSRPSHQNHFLFLPLSCALMPHGLDPIISTHVWSMNP